MNDPDLFRQGPDPDLVRLGPDPDLFRQGPDLQKIHKVALVN